MTCYASCHLLLYSVIKVEYNTTLLCGNIHFFHTTLLLLFNKNVIQCSSYFQNCIVFCFKMGFDISDSKSLFQNITD